MALLVVLLGLGSLSQTAPPTSKQDQNIPEEDAAVKPKDYTFNPLQAVHELKAGDYYFHRGNCPQPRHDTPKLRDGIRRMLKPGSNSGSQKKNKTTRNRPEWLMKS
jgi:hypothetical protein